MIQTNKQTRSTTSRLISDLLKQKWRVFLVIISVILATLFNVAAPSVLGNIINQVVAGISRALQAEQVFTISLTSFGWTLPFLSCSMRVMRSLPISSSVSWLVWRKR